VHPQASRPWTDADQSLLYTCYLAADLLAGRTMRPAPVSAPFRPQLGPSERLLAMGPLVLMTRAGNDPIAGQWQVRRRGSVTVSEEGLYLLDRQALTVWDWPMIHAAEVVGFNQLSLTVVHPEGPVAWWLMQSPYAELAFVLWAAAVHPEHRQLAENRWLPPGWPAWVTAQGRQLPALPG